jgi:hypothetical protein
MASMLCNVLMYHVICSFDKMWYKSAAFYIVSRTDTGPTWPFIQSVPETHSSGVNQPRCEANHSPSSSTKVKKEWSYTPTLLYYFKGRTTWSHMEADQSRSFWPIRHKCSHVQPQHLNTSRHKDQSIAILLSTWTYLTNTLLHGFWVEHCIKILIYVYNSS